MMTSQPAVAARDADAHRSWRLLASPAAVLLLFVLVYLLPLGHRPLGIPDEARYAEIPREMLVSGDWISPTLIGLRYFEKPPLGYWLNAGAIAVFGENPFAVRIAGALAAGATSLTIYLAAMALWRQRRLAVAAALVHLSSLATAAIGTYSVLDNVVTLFLTVAIVFHYLAITGRVERLPGALPWLLAGIGYGLAFLSKGFLAFAVPFIVLVPWMLWHRRWQALLAGSGWVLLATVITVLPWAIAIHLREPDFWHYFVWVEHIERFTTAGDGQHGEPFYYLAVLLPLLLFPWFTLLPATVSGIRRAPPERGGDRDLRFLLLWAIVPFVFFSLSSGKLATYLLPCFPPFALLTAVGLERYLEGPRTRLFGAGMAINVAVCLLVVALLLASQAGMLGDAVYATGETPAFLLAVVAFALGGVCGIASIRAREPQRRFGYAVLLVALPLLAFQWVFPAQVYERKAPDHLIAPYRELITQDSVIVSDGPLLHAAAWYLQRQDVYLLDPGEVSYGLSYPDAADRLLDRDRFERLLHARPRDLLVLCKRACTDWMDAVLPADTERREWGTFSALHVPAPSP